MPAVRNETLVLSDSDICLERDYLRTITAPLRDPAVGFVCTPYKGVQANTWYEKFEVLSLHDYTNQVVFFSLTITELSHTRIFFEITACDLYSLNTVH